MLRPCPKNRASPSLRLGSMSSVKIEAWLVSGASSMITSAQAAASALVSTFRPCSCAFSRDLLPSRRPITTSTPESRSDSECACPGCHNR